MPPRPPSPGRGTRWTGGAEEVLLFTDRSNATSNALYRRLGCVPVREVVTYAFPGG